MNVFSGRQLRKRSGVIVYPEDELQKKVVGLYFSANWCPPCREFTPILKDFYDELRANDLPFEIVFISSDKKDHDLDKYMKDCHGDWLAVPFGNEIIRELKQRYFVRGDSPYEFFIHGFYYFKHPQYSVMGVDI